MNVITLQEILKPAPTTLALLKESAITDGGIMISCVDTDFQQMIQQLRSWIIPIIRHSTDEIQQSGAFDEFTSKGGGYISVQNQAYSHFVRFLITIDQKALPLGFDRKVIAEFRNCINRLSNIVSCVMVGLERAFSLPDKMLISQFSKCKSLLEYNYYYPLDPAEKVAGSEIVDGKFMRMKAHIDVWPLTLTIPAQEGLNALQFADVSENYSHVSFSADSVLLHFGRGIQSWLPDDCRVLTPLHRVVTNSSYEERFSCLVKYSQL